MNLLESLRGRMSLPVIGSPMFIASGPELVIAQCTSGVLGTMPSRSIREANELGPALERIRAACDAYKAAHPDARVAPFGINLTVHKSNERFPGDLEVCIQHKVPLIITSLGPSRDVVERVHAYGGHVLHDVVNMRHARKAIKEGVDGLILVCTGAGGHAGALSPFALMREVRAEFDGPVVLGGAISDGWGVHAALAMGADLAYMGTRFIATREGGATDENKQMILDATAEDIFYTTWGSGIPANYLRASYVRAGLDPDNLPPREGAVNVTTDNKPKAWKELWAAGQGVGSIRDLPGAAELIQRMTAEFREASQRSQALAKLYV